jgi:hypothetical protein
VRFSAAEDTAEGGCVTRVSSVKGRRIEPRAESASAATLNREAGNRSSNPEEVRVDKKDSPRISEDIHIDKKQPLEVSLKGSSLEPFGFWTG